MLCDARAPPRWPGCCATPPPEILPRFRRLARARFARKSGPLDLVTDATKPPRRTIEAGHARLFPGCAVVGEEAAAATPAVLAGWAAPASPSWSIRWTARRISPRPAGLRLHGRRHPEGRGGRRLDHDPLATTPPSRCAGGRGPGSPGRRASTAPICASPRRCRGPDGRRLLLVLPAGTAAQPRHPRLPALRLGGEQSCAAHEYRWVSGGHGHGLLYNRLMPWDHLPGWAAAPGSRRLFRPIRWQPLPAHPSGWRADLGPRPRLLGGRCARPCSPREPGRG